MTQPGISVGSNVTLMTLLLSSLKKTGPCRITSYPSNCSNLTFCNVEELIIMKETVLSKQE